MLNRKIIFYSPKIVYLYLPVRAEHATIETLNDPFLVCA